MSPLHINCACHPDPTDQTKLRLLWTALMLVGGFSLIAWSVGRSSHSLALMAEAGHMISDCGALGLAVLATWLAGRAASDRATFGYRRVEVLAALVNGLGLVVIALWVGWEAVERLQAPQAEILGVPMLVTAAIGLGVNTLNAALLHDHSHHDLNLKGAFLHMLADALSSIGVIGAAIAVWAFGWNWADGAISLLVAGLILAGSIPLIRQSLDVLLEKAPDYLNLDDLRSHLEDLEGVAAVEGLRVWTIAPGQEALSVHLKVRNTDAEGRDRLLHTIQTSLHQEFGIRETFVQMTAALPLRPITLSSPETLLEVVSRP